MNKCNLNLPQLAKICTSTTMLMNRCHQQQLLPPDDAYILCEFILLLLALRLSLLLGSLQIMSPLFNLCCCCSCCRRLLLFVFIIYSIYSLPPCTTLVRLWFGLCTLQSFVFSIVSPRIPITFSLVHSLRRTVISFGFIKTLMVG